MGVSQDYKLLFGSDVWEKTLWRPGKRSGDNLERQMTSRKDGNKCNKTTDKIRENGFELTKKRSIKYPAKTITDADYADDIAILANTPDQAETLLHSLEREAAGIGLYVNAHKTEYMCYNQTGDISTLDGTPLKLVDKFTYLGSINRKGHRHEVNESMDSYQ